MPRAVGLAGIAGREGLASWFSVFSVNTQIRVSSRHGRPPRFRAWRRPRE
jgi:hypothetical protein